MSGGGNRLMWWAVSFYRFPHQRYTCWRQADYVLVSTRTQRDSGGNCLAIPAPNMPGGSMSTRLPKGSQAIDRVQALQFCDSLIKGDIFMEESFGIDPDQEASYQVQCSIYHQH
jgi:hypothetical protein